MKSSHLVLKRTVAPRDRPHVAPMDASKDSQNRSFSFYRNQDSSVGNQDSSIENRTSAESSRTLVGNE